MKKTKTDFSFVQQSTPWGGSTRILEPVYHISVKPIDDVKKWGHLAYVSKETREAILATGAGEMQAHIDYIKGRVGAIRKLRGCGKPKQDSLAL